MQIYNILYFGIWGYGYYGLKALNELKNVNIVNVFSKWDTENKESHMNKVCNYCLKHEIPITNSDKQILSKNDFKKIIMGYPNIDFIVSCCFDRIFSNEILEKPKIASLNIHPSLLPKFRGVKPLENAILTEKETGVTMHLLTEKLDAGDILIKVGGILIELEKSYENLYNEQGNLIIKLIKSFFSDPFHFLENKSKQNKNMVTLAPRLPFSISDNDTVQDIRYKYDIINQ